MSLVQAIISFLKQKDTDDAAKSPEGFCPNCWGRQDYGGKFYEAVKSHNLDVNSPDAELGWINDYANKHLSGVALQKTGDDVNCPTCKLGYKSADD